MFPQSKERKEVRHLFDLLVSLEQTLKILTSESQCNKAEHPALYSDILMWKFPQEVFNSANMVINAAVVLPFLGLNSDNQERLRNQISKVARSKNYEGKWNLVERLVRIEPYLPSKVLELILEEIGPNAFFGNNIKSMRKIYHNMVIINPYEPDQRPVKKPQRKRGYNDKGHLPLKHMTPKGRMIKSSTQEDYKEINEAPRFYSFTDVGDRSNIAAELVKRSTSQRRKNKRKAKKAVERDLQKTHYNEEIILKNGNIQFLRKKCILPKRKISLKSTNLANLTGLRRISLRPAISLSLLIPYFNRRR